MTEKTSLRKVSYFLTFVFCFVFILPLFVYSKYTTTINNALTINVRKPNYTVVFHSNDGNDNTASQSFVYGTSQQLNANSFVYNDYTFTRWNTEANGSGTSYDNEETVNNLSSQDGAIVDLYAQWAPDFIVTGNPTSWTNQNVTLTIVLASGSYSDYEYSFDDGSTWTSSYSKEFSANQDVYIKIRDYVDYVSAAKIESITRIDKTPPTISFSMNPLIVTLDESNPIGDLISASDSESGINNTGLQVYRYVIASSRRTDQITNTNYFTYPGLYAIDVEVSDVARNTTSINSQILVRWPTGGKYVAKKTMLDGAGIAGTGLSSSTSSNGLYEDDANTGADANTPFASKYYYTGSTVDNYVSFAGSTYRILNVSTNDDIKLLGAISDQSTSWGTSLATAAKIYDSNIYNTWSTKWWPRGQIYNNDSSGESNYKLFTDTEKAHLDLATFYAGRIDKGNASTIALTIQSEQTNAVDLGGNNSPSFQGYSAYPNPSDFLKASKAHDVIDSINDIDTASVASRRQTFTNNSWIDMTAEFWTMNARTGTLLQDNDYWVIDNDLGGHFEARNCLGTQQYRVVFYLTESTILSGSGTSSDQFTVEEDWAWFDNNQVLQ